MAKTTQDKRLLSIKTPLGKDYLLIDRFSVTEALSQLFSIDVELLHEENDARFDPTRLDPHHLVGRNVTITIGSPDGTNREFSGMVRQFSQGTRDVRFSYYAIQVVPHVWLLTQNTCSRIFQQKSVPEILKLVFEGFKVKYEIQGTYEPRNYCVQYGETDFDFASRLMEEEGIFYYFSHKDGSHEMVIADTPQSHRDCPTKDQIPFFVKVGAIDDFVGAVNSFLSDHKLQTGKVTLWDHQFQLPTNKLNLEESSRFSFGDSLKLEKYNYPGGYARKYDGIDKSGGEQAGELNKTFNDRKVTVTRMMESLDAQVITMTGTSDCCSITAGYRFELIQHPNSELNKKYVITSVRHSAAQHPPYTSADVPEPYLNTFTCIPHGSGHPGFRPIRTTAKPIVHGSQTAMVVGPAGEEIFTDKYGRVKVQFHWDRHGKNNEGSSCWVRVAQDWAGKKWGTVFIPRIGMEVVVDFLEGDPDQPIIVGSVYNAETMPPYTLPDEKTKSTIKTNSSKGSGGFNELRFEDKKGSEQIFIHAQKDMDVRVLNDKKEIIKRDKHTIIERHYYSEGKGDSHAKLTGNNNEQIGGSKSLKVDGDIDIKAGGSIAIEAGGEIHIKSGIKIVLEASTQVSLKVGGNFVDVNPSGVAINGTMVLLNSGGSAGSGSGCSTTSPTAPKEADTAQAGQSGGAQANMPPAPTTGNLGGGAGAMGGAANSGAPFVGPGGGSGGGSNTGPAPASGGHTGGGGGTGPVPASGGHTDSGREASSGPAPASGGHSGGGGGGSSTAPVPASGGHTGGGGGSGSSTGPVPASGGHTGGGGGGGSSTGPAPASGGHSGGGSGGQGGGSTLNRS